VLVAQRQQLEGVLQAGVHEAQVVVDVRPGEQGEDQAVDDLGPALLVEHFGVG